MAGTHYGRAAIMNGAPSGRDRVGRGALLDGRVVKGTATVSMVATRFRYLRTEALSAADSLALIEQIAEENRNT